MGKICFMNCKKTHMSHAWDKKGGNNFFKMLLYIIKHNVRKNKFWLQFLSTK